MASESGYQNQHKYGESQFKTIQGVGSDRFGVNTAQLLLSDVTPVEIAIVSVALDEQDPRRIFLEIPSHLARKGDILRFITSTDMQGWELEIIDIVDADILVVWNIGHLNEVPVLPQVGDEVKTCRWVTAKGSSEGDVVVTSGPVQFLQDGVSTTVSEDTTDPTQSVGLPVKDMSYRGGEYAFIDFATNPIPADDTTYVELMPALNASVRKLQIFMSSGAPLMLAIGAAASEVDQMFIIPGGNGYVDLQIAQGERLSVRQAFSTNEDGTPVAIIDTGRILVNLLG